VSVPTIDQRYGRTSSPRRRRGSLIALIVVIAVLAIAWFLWANPIGVGPQAVARDTGFRLTDDRITVTFDLSITPGATGACAVQALDKSFAVVGWKVVTYGAVTEETRSEEVTLRVTSPAVTGLVSSCWLT
jgi:hypothetical protein